MDVWIVAGIVFVVVLLVGLLVTVLFRFKQPAVGKSEGGSADIKPALRENLISPEGKAGPRPRPGGRPITVRPPVKMRMRIEDFSSRHNQ